MQNASRRIIRVRRAITTYAAKCVNEGPNRLTNTFYRALAKYCVLPMVFYYLKIPKGKLGKSKEILIALMNSFADRLEEFEDEKENPKADKKKLLNQLKRDFNRYVKETERNLKSIGIKRKLDFAIDLFLKQMKKAKEEARWQLILYRMRN